MQTNAAKNKGKCGNKLPVSGSEPTFTRKPYGTPAGIVSGNCYPYSVQHALKRNYKLQPGDLSKSPGNFNLSTCHPAKQRVIDDFVANGNGYETTACGTCCTGYAKIALLLSKDNDFHFLRQNGDIVYTVEHGETRTSIAKKFRVPVSSIVAYPKNATKSMKCVRVISANVWSHKRGLAFPPEIYDAKGNIIFDPRRANFDYGDLNYNKICSFFCVKQKKKCSRENAL
jgi:hypothetical protein